MAENSKFEATTIDIEQCPHDTSYLNNGVVKHLAWNRITVTVSDRETKLPKHLLSGVSGFVAAGILTPAESCIRIYTCRIFIGNHFPQADTLCRRDHGNYGSLWLWENHTS